MIILLLGIQVPFGGTDRTAVSFGIIDVFHFALDIWCQPPELYLELTLA